MKPYSIFLILLMIITLSACDEEVITPMEEQECVEGWVQNESGDGFYYKRCLQGINTQVCEKTFKIFLDVNGTWPDGPGRLTVYSYAEGSVEKVQLNLLVSRSRLAVRVELDKDYDYNHEVIFELPTDHCTVNGQPFQYTYKPELNCGGFANLYFEICRV